MFSTDISLQSVTWIRLEKQGDFNVEQFFRLQQCFRLAALPRALNNRVVRQRRRRRRAGAGGALASSSLVLNI
jgi:hypothetical protein